MTTKVDMDLIRAEQLLKLVEEHRIRCSKTDGRCTIMLFPLGAVYESLVKRNMTDKERQLFL